MSKKHPNVGDHVRLEVGDRAVEGKLVLVPAATRGAHTEAVQTLAGPPVIVWILRDQPGFRLYRLAKAGAPVPRNAPTPGHLFLVETLSRVMVAAWAVSAPVDGVRRFGAVEFTDDDSGYLAFQLHLQATAV